MKYLKSLKCWNECCSKHIFRRKFNFVILDCNLDVSVVDVSWKYLNSLKTRQFSIVNTIAKFLYLK